MSKVKFNHNVIQKTNCPFISTQSRAIRNGVALRSSTNCQHILNEGAETENHVNVGLLKKMRDYLSSIFSTNSPKHLLIIAEYGQGKSFSIRNIQKHIYKNKDFPIIGITLSSKASFFNEEHSQGDPLILVIIENLREAFDGLSDVIFSTKGSIKTQYSLDSALAPSTLLSNFDKAFKELNCMVFIFIDELDKVIGNSANTDVIKKRLFLENLKTLSDNFNEAISFWIAGTSNVEAFMNSIEEDYVQRFTPVHILLNEEDTLDYIKEKCVKEIELRSYIPFSDGVLKEIYAITQGNMRLVNACCFDLWLISAEKRKKIFLEDYNIYLEGKIREKVLEAFPGIDNDRIKVASRIIVNKRLSTASLKQMVRKSKVDEILQFIDSKPTVFKRIDRSYRVEDNFRNELLKKVVGK